MNLHGFQQNLSTLAEWLHEGRELDGLSSSEDDRAQGRVELRRRVRPLRRMAKRQGWEDLAGTDEWGWGVLALLYHAYLRDMGPLDGLQLGRFLQLGDALDLRIAECLESLEAAQLICSGSELNPDQTEDADLRKVARLEQGFRLHSALLARLLGAERKAGAPLTQGLEDPLQELLGLCAELRRLLPRPGALPHTRDSSEGRQRRHAFERLELRWRSIDERVGEAGPPLFREVRQAGLDSRERWMLLYLLDEYMGGMNCSRQELSSLVACDRLERLEACELLDSRSRLVSSGLVTLSQGFGPFSDGFEPRLEEGTVHRLMGLGSAHSEGKASRKGETWTLQPAQDVAREIVLPAEVEESLERCVRLGEPAVIQRLKAWGWMEAERQPSLLLCGPSGTGKSMAAGVLAARMGRAVMRSDVSQILSRWVGDSQQRLAELFDEWTRISREEKRAPLLLLDECDQLLARRMDAQSSSERMYNQLVDLLLERMETLPGPLVATTNRVADLDPAFSRRFDLKLTLPLPDAAARERIWELHLPPQAPVAADLSWRDLALEWPFAGGQIALCMREALREAALQDTCITTELLQAVCSREAAGEFGQTRASRPVGFLLQAS